MTKNILIFIAAFIGGTVIALAVRTALYNPHAGHGELPVPVTQADNKPAGVPIDPHAGHAAVEQGAPVNSICPICGMDVDPALPPATYQGNLVGFGCRACPPRFAKDPDKYGPSALRNVVAED